MINRSVSKCLPVICLLVTSSYTSLALADWSVNPSSRGHNQGYGDFPPADINEQLFGHLKTDRQTENSPPPNTSATEAPQNYQANVPVTQSYPAYNYQQPNYGRYNRGRRYQQNGIPGNYPDMNFSGPWNNNGSNFSGPRSNRGSGFSGPWNNNGSNFSAPWSNNNDSGFSPFGNRSGWSW